MLGVDWLQILDELTVKYKYGVKNRIILTMYLIESITSNGRNMVEKLFFLS